VTANGSAFVVATDAGAWRCRAVVAANGAHGTPIVPAAVQALPPSVRVLTAKDYRNPAQLDDGPVLVVGASATGVQLAEEIRRSGSSVTLAVGEHIRMPRVHRGLDIQWWLKQLGILDERWDQVDDPVRARRIPSPQLVGSPERATLDLNALTERGVEIVGRLAGADRAKLFFNGALANHCAMADLKANRLLERIDEWARNTGVATGLPPPERLVPTRVPTSPRLTAHAGRGGFVTIVLATGFKPDYSWLRVPAFGPNGQLRHEGGVVVGVPGVYALGLNFMRRRKSSFIHGAADDVSDLSEHLAEHLRGVAQPPRTLRVVSA
jgi:putative flavoprotein involved in K+ transport